MRPTLRTMALAGVLSACGGLEIGATPARAQGTWYGGRTPGRAYTYYYPSQRGGVRYAPSGTLYNSYYYGRQRRPYAQGNVYYAPSQRGYYPGAGYYLPEHGYNHAGYTLHYGYSPDRRELKLFKPWLNRD